MLIRKLYLVVSWAPQIFPIAIVLPLLLIPGIQAIACVTPIMIACL